MFKLTQKGIPLASLEEAYSNEYEEIIDAELAYDLYWANVISNKSDFQCPSEFCTAKVTCINLDVEKQSMQQSPHFRGYNHSDECDMSLGEKNKVSAGDKYEPSASNVAKSDNVSDIFRLNRPEGQFAKKKKNGKDQTKKQAIDVRRAKVQGDNKIETGSDYYSVRSLVSKFIRYKKEESLSEHYVNIAGKDISYKALFKGVYNQPLKALPKENIIYWGTAFINYLEAKNVYKITFGSELVHGGIGIRPSFFISKSMIDEYPVKSLVLKRLKKISKQKVPRAFVFLYSTPHAQGPNYVNFDVESLDYLEIRHLDLFDELKK